MPRPHRADFADITYHVINRANARLQIFATSADYNQFESVLFEAQERVHMRIYAYTVMPNHWHMIVSPRCDGGLTKFAGWLSLTHTKRWHRDHGTVGTGHLYQGRYKSFPIQTDEYFLTACRYVEQNSLRANLVPRAEDWRWGSLWKREYGSEHERQFLSEWPTERPRSYLQWVNERDADNDFARIRTCVNRGQPFGAPSWTEMVTKQFGLETTFRSVGRPWDKNNDS